MIDCLKMIKIAEKFIRFIEKTMKKGRVEQTTGGKILAVMKIQRGIFK